MVSDTARGSEIGGYADLPEVRSAAWSSLLLAAALGADHTGVSKALPFCLYVACYFAAGWGPLLVGLRAVRHGVVDVDLLMALAAVCAAGTGKIIDGALLFVIFAWARALGAIALGRTQDSLRDLLELAPKQATRINSSGEHETVPADDLAVGDEVVVGPGELIAADGEVVSGVSEVDQATVTGEAQLVAKQPGDEVFAGTVNRLGALHVRVTRDAANSVVARIAAQVDEATASKAHTQLVLQRLERGYSWSVVVVTAALLLVPYSLGSDFRSCLLRAMAFMIVASPCALMVATMPPLLAVVANAGRHGVLVKGPRAVEKLASVTTVAFDKTGSLTSGTPHVAGVVAFGEHSGDDVIKLAAAAEEGNPHPLARAILAAAAEREIVVPAGRDVRAEPGRGVHAEIDGTRVSVVGIAGREDLASEWVTTGLTVVVVLIDDQPAGTIAVSDRPRAEARPAVDAVHTITEHGSVMLTGDEAPAAHSIGAEVGIDDVRAQQLPADKLETVRELNAAGQRVMFVGDGINDAPALAAAHVGVAIAGGADLAVETADVVVLHGRLMSVPAIIGLSRIAQRVVTQNIGFAAIVVLTLVSLDMVDTLPLPLAVVGHEGSTLVVALNSLRLLSPHLWREKPRALQRLTPRDLRRYAGFTAAYLALGAWALLVLR